MEDKETKDYLFKQLGEHSIKNKGGKKGAFK